MLSNILSAHQALIAQVGSENILEEVEWGKLLTECSVKVASSHNAILELEEQLNRIYPS